MGESQVLYDPVKLKRKRYEAGLDQLDLARKAKVSQTHISRLERGAVPSTTARCLAKLARALRCKRVDLMPDIEPREATEPREAAAA
jgi:transcriptional regulator with XRE-family HTH domain